jgi:hypothetical protein
MRHRLSRWCHELREQPRAGGGAACGYGVVEADGVRAEGLA